MERATELNLAFAKASETERALFKAEQKAAALRHYGSQEALQEAIALAGQCIRAVAADGSDKGAAFAEAWVKSIAANDVWTLRTLAAHAAHTNAWLAGRPTN